MICMKCVLHWDVNDQDPPACKKPEKPKKRICAPPVVTLIRGEGGRRGPKKDRLDHVRRIGQWEINEQEPEIARQAFDYVTSHPAWGYDFTTETWHNHGV